MNKLCKLLFIFYCTYSGAVNIEIPNIVVPDTTIPPFMVEQSNDIQVPISESGIENILTTVTAQLSQALPSKYLALNLYGEESGIVADVTNPSSVFNANDQTANKKYNADLLLYGQLSSVNSTISINKLESSGQISFIYQLNVAVHYQLIKVSNKKVLADFITLGSAGTAWINSSSHLISSDTYLPVVTNDLYDSTFNALVMAFDGKDILQDFEKPKSSK